MLKTKNNFDWFQRKTEEELRLKFSNYTAIDKIVLTKQLEFGSLGFRERAGAECFYNAVQFEDPITKLR